jgi:hypothetical protein
MIPSLFQCLSAFSGEAAEPSEKVHFTEMYASGLRPNEVRTNAATAPYAPRRPADWCRVFAQTAERFKTLFLFSEKSAI